MTCRMRQGWNCRLVWNSGVFCMGIAALIQSLAALCVKLTNGRVPVFELVVSRTHTLRSRHFDLSSCPHFLSKWVQAVRSGLCLAATLVLIKMRGMSPVFGSPSNLAALLVRGVAGATSMAMYYFAIFILPLADVVRPQALLQHPPCRGNSCQAGV